MPLNVQTYTKKTHVYQLPSHMGGAQFTKNYLLGIVWNVQIFRENPCFPTHTPDQGQGQFAQNCFDGNGHEVSRYAQKTHV